MKEINVAEILKNCPKGMELDCAMWDNVTFISVDIDDDNDDNDYPIMIAYQAGENTDTAELTEYGCWNLAPNAKCVIFPKGKNTWEGFVPPSCEFKDGDVVVAGDGMKFGQSFLLKHLTYNDEDYKGWCYFGWDFLVNKLFKEGIWEFNRLATEEEKERLFQAIEEHGYKWNDESKTLEKLIEEPKFKNGDIILTHCKSGNTWISIFKKSGDNGQTVTYVDYYSDPNDDNLDYCCINNYAFCLCTEKDIVFQRFATEEEKQKLFQAIKENGYKWNAETETLDKLIRPKFKVGDIVKSTFNNNKYEIRGITDTHYTLVEITYKFKYTEPIVEDKNWELVLKFDINTLVPFESKVLMRSSNAREWTGTIFSHYSNNKFYGCGMCCDQCIPYEGNEHLLGKTDDCSKYFKTWE